MKIKNILTMLGMFSFVLLVSGCGTTAETEKTSSPEKMPTPAPMEVKTEQPPAEMPTESSTSFMLKVDSTDGQAITFSWELPDEMVQDAEKFMFLRSEDPDPTYPSNWYWWRGPSFRSLTWEGLPTGTAHFRVCVMKEEQCLQYSNDVEVTLE